MHGIYSAYKLPDAISLTPKAPKTVSPAPNASMEKTWYQRGSIAGMILGNGLAYRFVKRGIDLAVCFALLPILLPILAMCCLAIRLDSPGPIFFFQLRTGRGGRRFKMYKLRTMVKNAEELKEKYMHLNLLTYPDFKIANDPRITRVGGFLRKTSLDELPQIFNVLRGDMTLVGPRPTSFKASTYSLWHTTRLELKPGLTGLWQVGGRNELDFDERVRLDIAYLRNQCLWLDLQIMFRTIGAVFSGRGAN
jgi:lipopolysaccharide/colanic/teichoic acid biosynthesis glycosyltransferase